MLPLKIKNNMNRRTHSCGFLILFAMIALLTACNEQTVSDGSDMKNVEIDSTRTDILNVSGKLFSIPSPIQTALLIKRTNTPYNREALSNSKNSDNYQTKASRALNLGVYGTDMAYSSLYDDSQTALKYFKAVDNLANALEIKGAIDPSIVKRLGSNVGNSDSLLILSGKFYRAADNYLKANERYDIAALVLAGGWIESSYLTVKAAKNGNEAARKRLAAQKESIETLCEVLGQLDDKEFSSGEIKMKLDSLNSVFKKIEYVYTFEKPVTIPETKTTKITSKTDYNLSDAQLAAIASRIEDIRSLIIK